MRYALLLILLMIAALGQAGPAAAQADVSGEPYFHRGAQAYIGGDLQRARVQVREGLRLDPDNEKLQALQKKLDEERQQNSGASSDQNQQSQKDDSQQQPGAKQQEKQDPQPDQQPSQNNQQSGDGGDDEQPPEEQQGPREGALQEPPTKLTRQQAERILQALQNQEAQLLRQIQQHPGRPRRVAKDW